MSYGIPQEGAVAVDAFSLTWNNSYFYMFPPFMLKVKHLQRKLGQNKISSCGNRLVNSILAPIAALYGYGRILVFQSFKKQHAVDIKLVCHKN